MSWLNKPVISANCKEAGYSAALLLQMPCDQQSFDNDTAVGRQRLIEQLRLLSRVFQR
jgi:hypothetical protein